VGSARASAGGKLRQIAESDTVRNFADGLHSAFEASGMGSSSCLQRVRRKEAQLQAPLSVLPVGALVRLQGLQAAGHLNGRIGEVIGVIEDSGRHQVQLFPAVLRSNACSSNWAQSSSGAPAGGAEVKLVRRENIEEVLEFSTEQPPSNVKCFM